MKEGFHDINYMSISSPEDLLVRSQYRAGAFFDRLDRSLFGRIHGEGSEIASMHYFSNPIKILNIEYPTMSYSFNSELSLATLTSIDSRNRLSVSCATIPFGGVNDIYLDLQDIQSEHVLLQCHITGRRHKKLYYPDGYELGGIISDRILVPSFPRHAVAVDILNQLTLQLSERFRYVTVYTPAH